MIIKLKEIRRRKVVNKTDKIKKILKLISEGALHEVACFNVGVNSPEFYKIVEGNVKTRKVFARCTHSGFNKQPAWILENEDLVSAYRISKSSNHTEPFEGVKP